MINSKILTLVTKVSIAAMVFVVLSAFGAGVASARSTAICSPTLVQYDDAVGYALVLIQCADGTQYVAQNSPGSPCQSNARSWDVMKMFQSLAEAALLSGKSLNIGYNTCSGGLYPFIEALGLAK